MPVKPFLLIVVDRDKGEFTVEGPMTDDRPWNTAVCAAQDAGRQVNCCTAGGGTADEAAAEWIRQYGHRRVPAGSIVRPAPGRF